MKKKNKVELERVTFEAYFWKCFLEANHVKDKGYKHIIEGATFSWQCIKNRNPIVDEVMWEYGVIGRYINPYYNN